MDRTTRIPITGIGVIGPAAIGVTALLSNLRQGKSGIELVTKFDVQGVRAKTAGLLSGFNAKEFVPVSKMRRMNTLSRLGMAAMKLALVDAGIDRLDSSGDATGVALGTTFGPVQTSVEYLQEYISKGAALAPPQVFAESVANAAGSHIAIEYGLRGFNLTFTQREASALTALLFAASQMVKGSVSQAVCGGVEEMNDITFSVLDRIGALARERGHIPERCRPFDQDRNGMVVGEGSAIFLLQSEDDVRKRSGSVYGYVSGFGIAKDPTASISDWGVGVDSVALAMRRAIEDAGLEISEVDAIFASGNGSVKGDRLEGEAIRTLFAGSVPPVVAVKGYFGEYAAAGGLQLVAALLAIREQFLPATLGFEQADAGLHLPVVTAVERRPLRNVLVNSLSAGGGVVCCILSSSR